MAERMDTWFKHVFLGCRDTSDLALAAGRIIILCSLCWAGLVTSAEAAKTEGDGDKPDAVQVIMPEVQPREVSVAAIDDESFEIGLYAGVISIEDFGSEPVFGVKASYYATEDFFLQLNYGFAQAGLTSFEKLGGQNIRLLTDSERDYSYYNALVGYNIFPGEVFMTSKLTFNSSFYLVGGVGNTKFGGEDNFTTTLGTGYRIVLRDWLTWHVDLRDHIFKSDIISSNQVNHNIELSTGVTWFF
jgi:outer membrane beta-barrel protein